MADVTWNGLPLERGDVFAVRGKGWLSQGICKATASPGFPEGTVSHIGMLISVDPPIIIEALNRVKTRPLEDSLRDQERAYLIHDKTLTLDQRRQLIENACAKSADLYGYAALIWQLANSVTHTTWWTDHFAGGQLYCSYMVDEAYFKIGENFGVTEPRSTTPDEIYRWALSLPQQYDVSEILL